MVGPYPIYSFDPYKEGKKTERLNENEQKELRFQCTQYILKTFELM